MANRYLDWLKQAEADLRHSKNALKDEDFEWCCFAAQQAAEKALKAVFQKKGQDAWGHTLTALVGNIQLDLDVPKDILRSCQVLDKHYIPTRYPNGFDSGAPTDFYTIEESEQAIKCAEAVIGFCRRQID